MSDGSEFQVCGAATENGRRANSVRVLAADSSRAMTTKANAPLLGTATAERTYRQQHIALNE